MKLTLLASLILIMFLLACSKSGDENPLEPGSQSWEYGDSRSYNISSTEVTTITDDLTGYNFVFPEGGGGNLEIKVITNGPAISYTTMRFEVNYSGADALALEIPKTTAEEILLLGFGSLDNVVIDDALSYENWWGIPTFYDDASSTMFIIKNAPELSKEPKISFDADPNRFAIYRFKEGSSSDRFSVVRTSVRECINLWLNNMSGADRIEAENLIDGDLKYYAASSQDGNAYLATNSSFFTNSVFQLDRNVNINSIAHEVGHYMHHVLCGYDEYNSMVDRFPKDSKGEPLPHDAGAYREGRAEILEEIPGFSEYIVVGDYNYIDPTNVNRTNNIYNLFNSKLPSQVDYPAHEGFGCLLQ